jgi:outer membrane protein assembly factor BamB
VQTGRTLWSYDAKLDGGYNFHGAVLAWRDLVLVGTDAPRGGNLYAFEQATGRVRWQQRLRVSSDLVLDGDHIVVVSETSTTDDLICLEAASGVVLWQFPMARPEGVAPTINQSAGVQDGRVFFAGLDGKLHVLDGATGDILWERSLGAPARTATVLHGGSIYVGLQSGEILRLDRESGEPRGERALGDMPGRLPAVVDSSVAVYVGWMRPEGTITVLDAELRTIRWRHAAPGTSAWTSARLFSWGDALLAGTDQGEIFAFDPATGRRRGGWLFGGTIRVIHVVDDVWYVGTVEGRFAACTPQ